MQEAISRRENAAAQARFDERERLEKGAQAAPPTATETQRLAGETVEQASLPGMERSAKQAAAAREGALKARVDQEKPGGLFAEPAAAQRDVEDAVRAPAASRIEDVGEKIGGARKDVWAERGLRASDLEGMSQGEAHQNVVKEHVWPKPDYAAAVRGGATPEAIALTKIVRDRLPARPRVDSEKAPATTSR